MKALDIQGLEKSFGARRVLRSLDLSIAPGEVYGLLGPNGAGKSTTLKIICGLLRADAGKVMILGDLPSQRAKYVLGVVSQEICVYDKLTCAENLEFVAALYDLRGPALASAVERSLSLVQLTDRRSSLAETLSGGMRRRLHVALGLVHQPRLSLLDEPTEGMDIESRHAMWGIIDDLRRGGLAVLLTTHLVEEAQSLCDRIGILHEGRISAEGSVAELVRLVPAQQIVLLRGDEEAIVARLVERKLEYRKTQLGVQAWLPRRMELSEALGVFDGVAVDSLSQRPVSIEDVYMEVVHGG